MKWFTSFFKKRYFIDDFFEKHEIQKHFEESLGEMDPVVNILLVYFGKRPSFLLESANFEKDRWRNLHRKIKTIVSDLNLVETLDPLGLENYPRYFISKKPIRIPQRDQDIAQLLGMSWSGDFSDFRQPRHTIGIVVDKVGEIFTQIVGGNVTIKPHFELWKKRAKDWEKTWNANTQNHKLSFSTIKLYDPGTLQREKKMMQQDLDYIKKHSQDFDNDAWNYMSAPSVRISKGITPRKLQRFKKMYKEINEP